MFRRAAHQGRCPTPRFLIALPRATLPARRHPIDVTGNTLGLSPEDIHDLERTFRRRVLPDEVVSSELAKHLTHVSHKIGRQVGVLLGRDGKVENVFVGDAAKIAVPDPGRLRGGPTRFRGVRLIHTHLKGEPLTHDDLTDLALLRLDMIAAIEVKGDGAPGRIDAAHVLPVYDDSSRAERRKGAFAAPAADVYAHFSAPAVHLLHMNFHETIRALEAEFARAEKLKDAAGTGRKRALLVGISPDDEVFAEMKELIAASNTILAGEVRQKRDKPDPRTIIGKGKLEEVSLQAMRLRAELAIFDVDVKPAQAKHFEDATGLKAIDRTQCILDIFGQRAKSRDGKLQVELAQLQYEKPRLADKDAGLSRFGGVNVRGPGETQMELSGRRIRDRIVMLEKDIEKLSRQRDLRRDRRRSENIPVISIIGYTNAGKSTLLNVLTHSDIEAADKLFVTLDPTSRRLRFPRRGEVIITDTVGFIRDLPDTLVNAFRATLEELVEADLLLHVVDAADPQLDTKMKAVENILAGLKVPDEDPRKSGSGYRRHDGKGAPTQKTAADIPRLVVFNKMDLLDNLEAKGLANRYRGIAISAKEKTGIRELVTRCEEILRPTEKKMELAEEPAEAPAEAPVDDVAEE